MYTQAVLLSILVAVTEARYVHNHIPKLSELTDTQ